MTGKYKEKMIRVKECCGCKSCLPFNGNLVCYKLDRTLNRPYTIPSDCPLEDVPEPTPVTAAKPPCKTCGGAGRVEDDDDDMSGPEPSYKSCPDCRAKTVNEDSVTVLKNGELSDIWMWPWNDNIYVVSQSDVQPYYLSHREMKEKEIKWFFIGRDTLKAIAKAADDKAVSSLPNYTVTKDTTMPPTRPDTTVQLLKNVETNYSAEVANDKQDDVIRVGDTVECIKKSILDGDEWGVEGKQYIVEAVDVEETGSSPHLQISGNTCAVTASRFKKVKQDDKEKADGKGEHPSLPWTWKEDWYCDKASYAACPKKSGGCVFEGKVCEYLTLHLEMVGANGIVRRYPSPEPEQPQPKTDDGKGDVEGIHIPMDKDGWYIRYDHCSEWILSDDGEIEKHECQLTGEPCIKDKCLIKKPEQAPAPASEHKHKWELNSDNEKAWRTCPDCGVQEYLTEKGIQASDSEQMEWFDHTLHCIKCHQRLYIDVNTTQLLCKRCGVRDVYVKQTPVDSDTDTAKGNAAVPVGHNVQSGIGETDPRDRMFIKVKRGYRPICLYNGLVADKCPNNLGCTCSQTYPDYPRHLYHDWDGKNVLKCLCG
jgi:hypothetical protein